MPWTLGDEVHVENLHAREGVHIDGDSLESALEGKQNTLTGTSDVPGLDAALATKQHLLTFRNSIFPSAFGSINEDEGNGMVTYTPPDLSAFQLSLDIPVTAAPSGYGALTLSSSIGYNTLLTYTPPDLDDLAPIANPTFTGVVGGITKNMVGLGNCDNTSDVSKPVSSAQQTAIDAKISSWANGGVTIGNTHFNGTGSGSIRCRSFGPSLTYDHVNITSSRILYLNATHGIYAQGSLHISSDDRIKHNEVLVARALSAIRQLTPRKYQKTQEMYSADLSGAIDDNWVWETGLIAQEVMRIPELAFCVKGSDAIHDEDGKEKEMPFGLNYTSIFVYGLAAIKELDAQVQSQQQLIATLEARVASLESR